MSAADPDPTVMRLTAQIEALEAERDEAMSVEDEIVREMQSEWFIREVKRCREIGMPLGCCDEWPECTHVLAWVEQNPLGSVSVAAGGDA
jgi:hypothetical protein